MAYSSRGSGGRSRSSGRGGGGRSGGGGGANNAVPMVVAGVGLVLVVSLVFILAKKDEKPKPPPEQPTISSVPKPESEAPKKPTKVKGPLPPMPASLIQQARALMPEVKAASEKGTALYNEAMKAKETNDQDTWQAKMEEAREVMKSVRDQWLEIEQQVMDLVHSKKPENWEEDEATQAMFDVNLKSEASDFRKLIDEPLSRMAKTGRSR